MAIQPTACIWHNGNLILGESNDVMSHVVHYGSSVFEGICCYGQPGRGHLPAAGTHAAPAPAKIYRMPLPYSLDQLCSATVEVVENNVAPYYVGRSRCVAMVKWA